MTKVQRQEQSGEKVDYREAILLLKSENNLNVKTIKLIDAQNEH